MENAYRLYLILLPSFGFLFLFVGFCFAFKICAQITFAKRLWQCLLALIVFFLLGYLALIYHLISMPSFYLPKIVSLTYFAGGIFVFLVTFVVHKTIRLTNASHQLEMENKSLAYLAAHDHLTQLVNRAAFEKELDKIVDNIKRGGPICALLFVDIDKFKSINDLYGHAAGDEVLKRVAYVFMSRTRATDVVARIGGDEFVLLLYNVSLTQARQFADTVLALISELEFSFNNHLLHITGSVGITAVHDHTLSGGDFLAKADAAVYQSKTRGAGKVSVIE